MAKLTINIPDQQVQRILNGFAFNQGYMEMLDDGTRNPETKEQFLKRKVMEYIKSAVRNTEVETARNLAATQAANSVENEIGLR